MNSRSHNTSIAVILILLLLLLLPAAASGTAQLVANHTEGAEQIAAEAHDAHDGEHDQLGKDLPLWTCVPFAGILLSIALFPIMAPGFWHHHFPKISFGWALTLAVPFLIAFGGEAVYQLLHILLADYIPFIILLWGLFTVSGGIYLRGNMVGKPVINLAFLIVGTLLASWMGTTGAAMLLIRPLIRANRKRHYKLHTIVFFIFLVANIGGSLTPLGDPPLFLGFLHGVPFFWTFEILPHMLVAIAVLLAAYFLIDTLLHRREQTRRPKQETEQEEQQQPSEAGGEKLHIYGSHNFLLLLGIMGAVLMSGSWHAGEYQIMGVHMTIQSTLRDVLIILIGIASLMSTKKEHRTANGFTWFPIQEVAYLFAGIFITIIPPLLILKAGTEGSGAFLINIVNEPYHYFWITGTLSAFLDNAPTYLTFFNLALGKLAIAPHLVTGILNGVVEHANAAQFVTDLRAISAGAVFFGAMTYIGNAPNFMVRSIAEESHIRMPSFFGYMLWSIAILLPLFVLITFIFF
jgi:Na+/H+ antiporter NhaD/arsenite permease-like protein